MPESSASPQNDPPKVLSDLQTEQTTLNRVSHRLAMTDPGPALEKVLSLLLPRLLSRIGKNDDARKKHKKQRQDSASANNNNKRKLSGEMTVSSSENTIIYDQIDSVHDAIHKKLIEMLTHTMKRVREDRSCKLPCGAVLELLTTTQQQQSSDDDDNGAAAVTNAFTVNLSLMFLTLGLNRCSPKECASLLPGLLQFWASILRPTNNTNNDDDDATTSSSIGVLHFMDPSRKMRHDQTWHLIFRCLESISHNPTETAAARRAASSSSNDDATSSSTDAASAETSSSVSIPSLINKTKQMIAQSSLISAALFDLFVDVFLYTPVTTSTTVTPGLSPIGYQRLVSGSASQKSGAKNFREEFVTRMSLRELKLKLLDLIAPCRRFALFMLDKQQSGGSDDDDNANDVGDEMGISRTVALMVLLTGDPDPDIKSKSESYLRAHMDSYRGKDIVGESSIHDALLGNSIALAQSIMSFSIGDISLANSKRRVKAKYQGDSVALKTLQSSLGLTYHYDASNDAEQKTYLSVCRMKVPDYTATPALKFVAKMLEDNPKLFQVGIDMGLEEADAAGVYVGTLALAVFSELRRPGSSSSSVLESAASLLHALCVRLTLFYDARTGSGRDRLRVLLAQSLKLASDVLTPTSAGELTSTGTNVTKTAIGVEIRDHCYGLISTLARSNFALDERQEIFDCGNSSSSTSVFTSIATATLLFGCSSNETEILRPRATSALDALLGGYTRVISLRAEQAKKDMLAEELIAKNNVSENPWADLSANGSGSVSVETKGSKDVTESLARSLSPLIWNAARRSQPKSSRLAAARWSHELLSHIDAPNAYHLLCFLSGDDDATVSMIAKQAMGVDKSLGEDINLSSWTKDDSNNLPSFGEIMSSVVRSKSRPKYTEFHLRAQAASLRFMVQSLFSEESFYGDELGGDELRIFVSVILDTLSSYRGRSLSREEIDLVDECAICLSACTSSSSEGRSLVRKFHDDSGFGFNDISMQALNSHSAKARRHFSEVVGHLYEDHALWTDSPGSFSVSDWIEITGLKNMATICTKTLGTMFEPSFVLGEVHGAAFLGSQCVRALRLAETRNEQDTDDGISDCWTACAGIVSLLGKGLAHSDAAIGNACSRAIVIAFSYDGQDAPNLNKKLFDAVAIALGKMNASLKKFSSIDHADANRAVSLIEASGLLLAASTSGAGSSNTKEDGFVGLGGARLQCVDSLFGILGSAVYKKDDELSLAVGEALVKYADAFGRGEWSSSGSGAEWPEGPYNAEFAFSLPPHVHILYTLFERELKSTNPMKKNSCAPVMLAIVGHASRLCNIDTVFSQRAMIQEVTKFMIRFQNNFIHLLSHPKATQLSRESCCRGIAALRGLSTVISAPAKETESLNARLLKAFGETSNYGGSAMIETEAQARERRNDGEASNFDATSAEVGGTSGLSEAALGAYREMSSAAISCDRPDVLYSLMMLSTSHEIWSRTETRDLYGAKSILGKSGTNDTEEIRIALRPHLGKLIPRLLRACNDPNKQTREQMNNLWTALTGGGAESRALISQHFLTTMDILIEEAGSKLWRARVGACGALADIIVGRSWGELGGGGIDIDDEGTGMKGVTASIRLLRLWRITMRALDDVRTPVRERGDTLGRGVRALTIRLCDPKAGENTKEEEEVYLSNAERKRREKENDINSEYAATVSLGWLVKYGLNQPCAEATGICISCLLGIVDVSKPTTLQPVLAELIGSLLMAMSGLEPSALNYLQVRAAGNESSQGTNGANGYDRLERLRIQLASSGPIAEALNKCLDMVKFVELDAQKKLIPELDSALRKGAGFATRASTADAVTTLCNTCPAAFKFPGSSNTNPTVRLLRAIYFASEKERGATAKDKMTHALGSISMIAPAKAVRILAVKACERYCEASGSNNNPSLRRAAAATVRAIVVRASNHLKDGGPKDVWRKKVLPIAFLGRKDDDAKVAALWNDVWDEGGTAVGLSGEDTFGVMLQEQLLPYLANAMLSALRSPSWSNRREACAVIIELVEANILSPAPRSTSGTQKIAEEPERFKQRAKVSSILLNECLKIIRRSRIWEGKGDVCSAASQISAKWTGVAESHLNACSFAPIVFRADVESLFEGDKWFKGVEQSHTDVDEAGDSEYEQHDEVPGQITDDDAALDMSGEQEFDEDDAEQQNSSDNELVETDVEYGMPPVTLVGLCRILAEQGLRSGGSREGRLPYRVAAFSALSALLKSVVPDESSEQYNSIVEHQSYVYTAIAPSLFTFVSGESSGEEKPAPVLVARAMECLASAMYDEVGTGSEFNDALVLLKLFSLSTGSTQPAWTVRQTAALAASSLIAKTSSSVLRRNDTILTVFECSSQALKDKKFWKVRAAGLELLLSLVRRVKQRGRTDPDNQLVMEAILPYKEKIVGIARRSLSDNESQVTAAASKLTVAMNWWP